jgi:hypothetical protein
VDTFSTSELASQAVLELPDRELLGGVIDIDGPLNLLVLTSLLNGSFNHWYISALNFNHLTVTVTDNVSQDTVNVFCNQVVAVLALQCAAAVDP